MYKFPTNQSNLKVTICTIKELMVETGNLVIIPPSPFDLSFFAWNKVTGIKNSYNSKTILIIGLHSLSGIADAKFVGNHPIFVNNLFLFPSFPAEIII